MSKEALISKGTEVFCLSLSFCVIIFRVSCWLIQGRNVSEKGLDRGPWLLKSFCIWSKFWFERIVTSWECQLHDYSVVDITCLTLFHLGPAKLSHIIVPLECCVQGITWMLISNGGMYITPTSSAQDILHHPTELQLKAQVQNCQEFQNGESRTWNQAQGPPKDTALWDYTCPWSWSCIYLPERCSRKLSESGFLSGHAHSPF